VEQAEADALAARLISFLETGRSPSGLFAEDVFVDFTSPRWRVQARGVAEAVALRLRGHPSSGRVPRFRCDPTPTGFVLEVEEEWAERGESWYCRELFRADVRGGAIAELSVYCTGDWDSQRRAEHAREVPLLRP
jgi:hypothetical protein